MEHLPPAPYKPFVKTTEPPLEPVIALRPARCKFSASCYLTSTPKKGYPACDPRQLDLRFEEMMLKEALSMM